MDEIFFENFSEGILFIVLFVLMWWVEEGQILDLQGIYYCIVVVKFEIFFVFLKWQVEEIVKGRQEEQKKKVEVQVKVVVFKKEEEEKKKKQESKESGGELLIICDGKGILIEVDEGVFVEVQNEVM